MNVNIAVSVAGLALAVSWAVSAAEPQVIEVRLGSYYFKPDTITVKLGQPVTLKLVNEATLIPHNLAIQAPDAGIDVKLDVSAGSSASTTFTPTRAGRYEMYCDKQPPFMASHKAKGMHGVLEVVP